MPIWKSQKLGFTLVEMLVVLGLLALSVGSALIILTSVLKGTNQATVSSEVKQNGQAILDSLERQIRNASSAQILASNYLMITRSGGDPLHIQCFPSTISTNGYIGEVADPSVFIPPAQSSKFISISNNSDLISGVDITSCSFSVQQQSLSSPAIVSISFTVNQAINAPSRQDFVAKVPFRTTISLRNYK